MNLALSRSDTQLLVIDVQERIAPAMVPERYGRMIDNLGRLGRAIGVLEVPALVSEQYSKGLGPTVAPVAAAFEGVSAMEKITFSAAQDEALIAAIRASGRSTVLVAGIETHVCVYQTARDLVLEGFSVHVLTDAVASRTDANYRIGLELMGCAGATLTSTEVVLFDLLGRAGTDAFKTVSRLVK